MEKLEKDLNPRNWKKCKTLLDPETGRTGKELLHNLFTI